MGSDATVLSVGKATHVGLVRARNEDAMDSAQPEKEARGALFLVADGMGGHSAGNVASRMAVDQVMQHYYHLPETDPSERLRQAVEEANRQIFDSAQTHLEYFRMGTTLVGAAVIGNLAHVANVGDSRLYMVRGNRIEQVTRDHSWVALQVEMGELTPEEAQVSQNRSVLLRCLGEKADVLVDILQMGLQPGDQMVLCTDGLHGLVKAEQIRDVVLALPPQEACDRLVALANEHGGHDNITVEVVRVDACPEAVAPAASAAVASTGSVPSPPSPGGTPEAAARASAPSLAATPLQITPVPPPPVPANPYPYGPPAPAPAPPLPASPLPASEPSPALFGLARWLAFLLVGLVALVAVLAGVLQASRRSVPTSPPTGPANLPATGGIPSPLAQASAGERPAAVAAVEDGTQVARLRGPVVSMAADSRALFWLEGSGSAGTGPVRLLRLPVAGARDRGVEPKAVPLPPGRYHSVAVGGDYLYLAGDHAILRIRRGDGPADRPGRRIPTRLPARIMASADATLYWVEASPAGEPPSSSVIRSVRMPAGRTRVVATPHGLITGLVPGRGDAALWAEEGSGIHGVSAQRARVLATGSPTCLASDGVHVFWTEASGDEGADTRLRRCAMSGGPPATVAVLRGAVTALAANSHNLFWAVSDGSSYSIKRLSPH